MNFTIVKIVQIGQKQVMESARIPTEEEVRKAARQGEDAVVALVVNLISSWIWPSPPATRTASGAARKSPGATGNHSASRRTSPGARRPIGQEQPQQRQATFQRWAQEAPQS